MLRQLKFQARFPSPCGDWRTREIAGPTTVDERRGSLTVFAFAMDILEAASCARLERYASHIGKLAGTYPDFWWTLRIPVPSVGFVKG